MDGKLHNTPKLTMIQILLNVKLYQWSTVTEVMVLTSIHGRA